MNKVLANNPHYVPHSMKRSSMTQSHSMKRSLMTQYHALALHPQIKVEMTFEDALGEVNFPEQVSAFI